MVNTAVILILCSLTSLSSGRGIEGKVTWNKTNRVDSNYAKFFTWTLQRGLGQPVNLTAIEELAQRCPQTDGNVVFLSQNLYNAITNEHRIFTTSCDFTGSEIFDNLNIIVKQ